MAMSFEMALALLIGYDDQHMIAKVENSVKLFSNSGESEETVKTEEVNTPRRPFSWHAQ
jgi:hypothetical protein